MFLVLGLVTTVVVAWGLAVVRPQLPSIATKFRQSASTFNSVYSADRKWLGRSQIAFGRTSHQYSTSRSKPEKLVEFKEQNAHRDGPSGLVVSADPRRGVSDQVLNSLLRHQRVFEEFLRERNQASVDKLIEHGILRPGDTLHPDPLWGEVYIEQWGAPFRAMQKFGYAHDPPGTMMAFNSPIEQRTWKIPARYVPWSLEDVHLPVQFIWRGIILNTLIYATAWFLLWRVSRRFGRGKILRRVRAGLCPACAYDLAADYRAGCPECGFRRDRA